MKLRVLAVGQKMPAWVKDGVAEYSKRLPPEMPLEWVELALGQRGKNRPVEQAMAQEGDAMLAAIRADDWVVALAVDGKSWSTPDLARQLENWWQEGRDICLLIGGPDGLDPRALARSDQRWSLSALTLPHPLVRVLLSEQLYRAWTITRNHPYHK
ncbi:23S rRNA (pseudouridine(1915)-N(3))-methyltransferase RlmH [Saccharospirillum sp. MSK14-1]|uniref:23S rRNA (pseudouridine(1915)-N(3))-methyltransferase RlmH n=1 Tax=Saccharospirillum sp. MSK14-1 TaxID=1897632 RepID=UPI000D37514E|nr:23S rRNA (pseudouridine(1915)-N(3))-methyltransferase RlmH [Saccharospirillum sp. MSK14-1]PTY38949.1 23S rRNA (pseudouridine(1915)-N(3))-methyltransferase RlmH [Saccharospirillum sp. MSK14-1]